MSIEDFFRRMRELAAEHKVVFVLPTQPRPRPRVAPVDRFDRPRLVIVDYIDALPRGRKP